MASTISHGHLEVTVVGCNIFSESSLASGSHPLYICFQYGGDTYLITIPSQDDGGMNTTFSNKFDFPIDGQSDLKFVVWKNIYHNLHYENFMGSGRVQMHNVVSEGCEESSCPFKKGNIGTTGELKLVLRYTHAHPKNYDPSSSAKSLQQSYPQGPSYFNNFSAGPTLSYCPHPFFHHSPPYPPPPSYYPPPPYYYPPSYPPLPSHHPQYFPLYPPPKPPSILPLSLFASVASIGASLFQFFED